MYKKRMNLLPASIHVVGCGGTGSRLVPMLVQLIASHPFLSTMTRIFLYDADVVELKNLSRQNFSPSDVGKNKALALASRYSKAYGIPVVGIPEFFPKSSYNPSSTDPIGATLYLMDAFNNSTILPEDCAKALSRSSIWISCVDNVDARLSIMNMLMQATASGKSMVDNAPRGQPVSATDVANALQQAGRKNVSESIAQRNGFIPVTSPIFIDAGNENTFGQVSICEGIVPNMDSIGRAMYQVFGAGGFYRSAQSIISNPFHDTYKTDVGIDHVPLFMDMIGRIEGTLKPPQVEASCADLDQTLAVNAQMAIGILTYLQNIILNHPIVNTTLYYDIHNGNSQDKITGESLKKSFGIGQNCLTHDVKKSSIPNGSRDHLFQDLRAKCSELINIFNGIEDEKLPSGATKDYVKHILFAFKNITLEASGSGSLCSVYTNMLLVDFFTKDTVDPGLLAALKGFGKSEAAAPAPAPAPVQIPEISAASPVPPPPPPPPAYAAPDADRMAALNALRTATWMENYAVDPMGEDEDEGEGEYEDEDEEDEDED